MAEEYDLSEALSKASSTSTEKKNKKATTIKVVVAGALGVAIVGAFVFGTQNWFAKNDFTKPIALSENITQWTSLSWDTENHFEGDLTNKFGTWSFDDENGNFTNDELKCSSLFTKLRGDYGDTKDDASSTEKYKARFAEGQEETSTTSKVFLPLKEYPEGGVEALKTYYTGSDGNYNVAYYRHSPENETIFLGVVTCETDESLQKVAPVEGDGSEIETLGFWLKP